MKIGIFTIALLLAQICFLIPIPARAIHMWTTDQLNSRSTLICEGTVISQKQEGAMRLFDYDGMKCPEVIMLAKIQVNRVIKGKAGPEIEFRYRAVEPPTITQHDGGVTTSITHFVVDGPQHVRLAVGMKFRFFLSPVPDSHGYVSVMEGSPDDGQSVSIVNSP